MPGDWLHLGRRFFSSVSARPLSRAERAELKAWLEPAELDLFSEQPQIDQRHGLESALFAANRISDRDVVRAAALHDIGKRHARLGVLGRVAASVCLKLRIPVRGRFLAYREHGPIGADELEALGSPAIAVAYARHHHGRRPAGFDDLIWRILEEADLATERRGHAAAER